MCFSKQNTSIPNPIFGIYGGCHLKLISNIFLTQSHRETAEIKQCHQITKGKLTWEVARRWTGLKAGDGICSQLRPREVRIAIKTWYRNALLTLSLSKSTDVKVWDSGATSRWTFKLKRKKIKFSLFIFFKLDFTCLGFCQIVAAF